jgi:hypothetical protein
MSGRRPTSCDGVSASLNTQTTRVPLDHGQDRVQPSANPDGDVIGTAQSATWEASFGTPSLGLGSGTRFSVPRRVLHKLVKPDG